MTATPRSRLLWVTLAVWLGTVLALRVALVLASVFPFLASISGAVTAAILLYAPFAFARLTASSIAYGQWDGAILWRNLKWFLIVGSILPGIYLLDALTGHTLVDLRWQSHPFAQTLIMVATQVLVVAFPEEFFFRGYVQGNFSRRWPPSHKILGAPFGKAQVITSLLFAISHSLITFQPWHILIFFPGLIFAWLKEKTGTIWAAVFFHAACNLFSWFLFVGPDGVAGKVWGAVLKMMMG